MSEPALLPRDFLRGARVGISVSESADLPRLGLTPLHCELAVAELARAIFVAGGTIVYGGRLVDPGYTDVLLNELRTYRDDRDALILCVPETEWRRLSRTELRRRRDELHTSARLICLDSDGDEVDINRDYTIPKDTDPARALSAMRAYVTGCCSARVIVGGRLDGYQGVMPGLIEEASLSVAAAQPLYAAGGFGGAAAAVAGRLGSATDDDLRATDLAGFAASASFLDSLAASAMSPEIPDGLEDTERRQLNLTYRAGDIASLVLTGLGRLTGVAPEGAELG